MTGRIPEQIRSIYFVGIGGIGMSALARYYKWRGAEVAGYDADRKGLGKQLESEGITVHYTEEESVLDAMPDLVVYTPAVPSTHAGLMHFREKGVPTVKRSVVLGEISRAFRCIAVAGTHGKTTTSALITYALQKSGVDVTAFLGGWVPDLQGNCVLGESEWLVVEADEYDRSFHTLTPEIAVVTAMDPDHLDIYGDHDEMIRSYFGFLSNVREGGKVLMDQRAEKVLSDEMRSALTAKGIDIETYGERDAAYLLEDVQGMPDGSAFELKLPTGGRVEGHVQMPGQHNALNASAALIVAQYVGVAPEKAAEVLASFKGIKRRFEIVHASDELVVIDDYAHHPEELKAAIRAARLQYPGRKLTGVFQPHLYSRTRDFHREFAEALDGLDVCVLVELYPARELPIEGVSSAMIFDNVTLTDKYLTSKQELHAVLAEIQPEILLFLGAGDLDRMIPDMIKNLIP